MKYRNLSAILKKEAGVSFTKTGVQLKEGDVLDIRKIGPENRAFLLKFSRQVLEDFFTSGKMPSVETNDPELSQKRATFITLRTRGKMDLRGCRGESRPRRTLMASVAFNTIASATDDPRFHPVSKEEIPKLHIEINALTPMYPIKADEVEVGKHGLMIVHDMSAGLLLPEVPLNYNWDREEFLQALCRKAWLPLDAWHDKDAELFGFEAEIWAEEE